MYNVVKKYYSALNTLAKILHVDIPQNRNIYLPGYKDNYALVYNNKACVINDLKLVLESYVYALHNR